MKIISTAILGIALLLTGCVSTGSKFDTAKTNDIKPGATTVSELTAWFGKPWSGKAQTDGTTCYVWQHTTAGAFVGVTEQQVLTVFVSPDGKVKDFTLKQKE